MYRKNQNKCASKINGLTIFSAQVLRQNKRTRNERNVYINNRNGNSSFVCVACTLMYVCEIGEREKEWQATVFISFLLLF